MKDFFDLEPGIEWLPVLRLSLLEVQKEINAAILEAFAMPPSAFVSGPVSGLMLIRMDNYPILLDSILAETETLPVAPPAEAPEKKPEEKKSALDEAKEDAEPKDEHGGSKPPEDGLCRECRQRRKLNRLKLCYPCFAILVLMEECKKHGFEWKPGDPHPDFCSCEGLGEHKNEDGTARGFN